jgi:hypothetical protein
MARQIKFVFGNQQWNAGLTKVDRDKVYGYVEEVVSDKNGNVCLSASLLDDGSTVILYGATALKTAGTDNNELDKANIVTVYLDNKPASLVPSSYDQDVALQECGLDDLFNLEVTAVYQLSFDDAAQKQTLINTLSMGKLFRFIFNYRADYEGSDAILLCGSNEIFALSGNYLAFEYMNKNVIVTVETESDAGNDETSMDFGML